MKVDCKQNVNCLLHYLKYKIKNFDKEIFFLLLRPMKIVPNKIIVLIVGLLCTNFTFAAPDPPEPIPPPPPGLPVDGGLLILFFASIILALYKTYTMKKASR